MSDDRSVVRSCGDMQQHLTVSLFKSGRTTVDEKGRLHSGLSKSSENRMK